jgi:D-alanine transaminase
VICYRNGEYLPRASATISVEDRGFIFGDGVYEVWRVIDGRLFEMERHLARLNFGLSELRITPPDVVRADTLLEVADRVLSQSGLSTGEASLYLEITRGAAPRTHAFPPAGTKPTVFITANKLTPPDEARARGATAITTPDIRWMRCDIKTVQLLPNVLAKQAASEKGALEAIFVRDGIVTEGSHTNLFVVLDGVLRTHPLTNLILPGISRLVVIEVAKALGLDVVERAVTKEELFAANEVFLSGTTTDVMPIVRIDDQVIGEGKPGDITTRLYRAFRAYMDEAVAAEPGAVSRGG